MYRLEAAPPNPSGATTAIRYALPDATHVRLTVYDGRAVAVLVDGHREAAQHAVRFEAGTLPTGVYLYQSRRARSQRPTG